VPFVFLCRQSQPQFHSQQRWNLLLLILGAWPLNNRKEFLLQRNTHESTGESFQQPNLHFHHKNFFASSAKCFYCKRDLRPQASTLKTENSLRATAVDGVRQLKEASGQARNSAHKGWQTNNNSERSDNSCRPPTHQLTLFVPPAAVTVMPKLDFRPTQGVAIE
jgi:hypothetical protein